MKQQPPIRVMCVDDNELVAAALERRVASEPHMTWVGWASSVHNVIEHVRRARPDIVLLDIDMPGPDVFETVRLLNQTRPETRVLMFSGYVRSDYIDRAIEAGAWGYISKADSIDEMLRAIEQVASGEFVLTPDAQSEQRRSHRPAAASVRSPSDAPTSRQ